LICKYVSYPLHGNCPHLYPRRTFTQFPDQPQELRHFATFWGHCESYAALALSLTTGREQIAAYRLRLEAGALSALPTLAVPIYLDGVRRAVIWQQEDRVVSWEMLWQGCTPGACSYVPETSSDEAVCASRQAEVVSAPIPRTKPVLGSA
jgi:hypothetical protein